MSIKTVLKSTRPSFLVLSPICVFLGLSTSLASQSQVNFLLFFLIFIGAILAHISVNMLNEYFDFKSGLDLKTERTAFSGGSGALPDNPKMAKAILVIGLIALLLTIFIGIYLTLERGTQIIPIGIVGVVLIITYTQWLNRFPFLCLIAPGLGFGILMVVGTHAILTGGHSSLPWLVSLVPFFLINNLLLLNQYPDMKADVSVGRNTFPIAFGLNKSNVVYGIFFMAAYLLILILVAMGYIPNLSIIAAVPIVFSLFALVGANKYTSRIGAFPRYLGANVAASVLTPLLLGISIIIG
jgi:1,4-dihydroxy-2-naphthoate octaprenyltransferase